MFGGSFIQIFLPSKPSGSKGLYYPVIFFLEFSINPLRVERSSPAFLSVKFLPKLREGILGIFPSFSREIFPTSFFQDHPMSADASPAFSPSVPPSSEASLLLSQYPQSCHRPRESLLKFVVSQTSGLLSRSHVAASRETPSPC